MKFGEELAHSVEKEWQDHYVSYKRLERLCMKIKISYETAARTKSSFAIDSKGEGNQEGDEESALLAAESDDASNLARCTEEEELEEGRDLSAEIHLLKTQFWDIVNSDLSSINLFFGEKLQEWELLVDESYLQENDNDLALKEDQANMVSKLFTAYEEMCKLRKYSDLNYLGLQKIVKKYDKCSGEKRLVQWEESLSEQPFHIKIGDVSAVLRQIEARLDKISDNSSETRLKVKKIRENAERRSKEGFSAPIKPRLMCLVFALSLTAAILPFWTHDPFAHRCFILLTFVTSSWVTEAIPFYVTSLCIPFLTVVLSVLKNPDTGNAYEAPVAAGLVFGKVFSSTLSLVLGGFAISTAFCKYQFELELAQLIQRSAEKRPSVFILMFMYLAMFLSMWVSNVAGSMLVTTVMLPIVRELPTDSRFVKALIIGVAFAANLGGMLSPISSPQNAIAVSKLQELGNGEHISFASWLTVSLPFCHCALIVLWVYLLICIRPFDISVIPKVTLQKRSAFHCEHYFVLAISALTVFLWCTLTFTEKYLGNLGTVALLPLVIFLSSGILTKQDFNNFSWNLIFLIGGGNVLGYAVRSSGLLQVIVDSLAKNFEGIGLWLLLFELTLFIIFITTFISHTVAAIILSPILINLGLKLGHVEVVVMAGTLACSSSMALPMSSFPNVNSLLMEDDYGKPYVKVLDFVLYGGIFSLCVEILLVSLGYLLLVSVF